MPLEVIVLAAGAGKRMRSRKPKVLHTLGGRPLLGHVLAAAFTLNLERVHVVIGNQAGQVKAHFDGNDRIAWVVQEKQQGTGHAVAQALPSVADDATVLVLLGDVPLVAPETLAECVESADKGLALVTIELEDPTGFGRIVRRDGRILGIVEEADATPIQALIREVNTGILAAPKRLLEPLIGRLGVNNKQGEYYLTDVVVDAAEQDIPVTTVGCDVAEQVQGVNDKRQLAILERYYQRQQAMTLMAAGVTVMDPERIDVRGRLTAGTDCVIDVGTVFEGDVRLGDGVSIGANCVIKDATLADDVTVAPLTHIDGANVGRGCRVGPYARLRPGSVLAEDVHIGNFVETKKARLGANVKANHLAYIGDASVGARTNVGAGAITCNYDGIDKHHTDIGDDVFVGTNATLVAPVTVEDGAYVAAGSTITKPVHMEELAVGRGRQRNIQGWTPPAKRRR